MEEVSLAMGEYREIITKAVVAKGRKYTKSHHTICPDQKPSNILGCWIINHQFDAKKIDDTVEVCGSYEINVWYSYRDNTKTDVISERVDYTDVIKVKYRDKNHLDDKKVIARALQQPNCMEATLSSNGNKMNVHVERELLVEVIGETKVCVRVSPRSCADQDDEWDLTVSDEELENINTDFLLESEEE